MHEPRIAHAASPRRSTRRPVARTARARAPHAAAEPAHAATSLAYVSDAAPGIRRVAGRGGFAYRWPDDTPVNDDATLARIRALAIPPAYVDVWICTDPRGHLQATGRDARGRKQYRYHPQWRRVRDAGKFGRVEAFGRALPALRPRLRQHLALPGLPRDKVLALVVGVLAETLVRIGNREYVRTNGSFGLTTLRNRHVRFLRGTARFCFRGKHGIECRADLDDPRLVKVLRRCQQLPGQALFQYVDDDGALQAVDSEQVNAYVRAAMGADFSAKDFRTWGATVAAIDALRRIPPPAPDSAEREIAQLQNQVVRDVAEALGNTQAVCRASYIHPAVFTAWRSGRLAPQASGQRGWSDERVALHVLRAPTGRRRRSTRG